MPSAIPRTNLSKSFTAPDSFFKALELSWRAHRRCALGFRPECRVHPFDDKTSIGAKLAEADGYLMMSDRRA
jgi:hypothetical protein